MIQGSIVVPCYNSASTIKETMISISSQTALSRISSIYLVDDASSDDTVKIAESVWNNPSVPLIVLHNPSNAGERTSVNRAFSKAMEKSQWLFILHSDDIAKPEWLETIFRRIDACGDDVGSICSSWDNLLPNGSIVRGEDDAGKEPQHIPAAADAVAHTLKNGCWWHISGCAIRAKTFLSVGEFNVQMPQMGDTDWLIRCLRNSWSVDYIPRTLIIYRLHKLSVSSSSFKSGRDVSETMRLLNEYGDVLTKEEITGKYRHLLRICFRRTIKYAIFFKFNSSRCYLDLIRKIEIQVNQLRHAVPADSADKRSSLL